MGAAHLKITQLDIPTLENPAASQSQNPAAPPRFAYDGPVSDQFHAGVSMAITLYHATVPAFA
ncbi:MAG: hypothetical protein ABW110_24120 [Steroidobacteraceae bacterium]